MAFSSLALTRSLTICGLAVAVGALPAIGEDWPRFLGTAGQLKAEATEKTPTKWGDGENVKWATELPGKGVSSPIVVGDLVFVTCYSGYGVGGENESIDDLTRHVICVDKATGKVRWQNEIKAVQPEDPYEGVGVPAHGYASHTPVSDGKRVYAFLGKSGVVAFDLEGNELWRQSVGTGSGPQGWGSSASPVVYQDTLIVTASEESETMFGINAESGEIKWKQEAQDLQSTWSTPTLVTSEEGRTDLVINVPGEVWGINPETGKLRWYSRGTTDASTAASLTPGDGLVFATGGRGGEAVAVKVGGKGDVNDTHVIWDAKIPGRFSTPLYHNDLLFTFGDSIMTVFSAEDGDKVGQLRLGSSSSRGGRGASDGGDGEGNDGEGGGREGGGRRGGGRGGMFSMDYASPVLIGDNIYMTSRSGTVYVLTATRSPELIAENSFPGDSGFGGTPAVSDGEIFIRSDSKLYCLSNK
ncbi:PQQ-like beta-propeller repeat protein [Rubripirellula amarantea]|nr:PQQ-like beta-propeller repeat protein [Rubripirellula amarantea]